MIEVANDNEAPVQALTPVADAVSTALAEITKTNTTITQLADHARELGTRYSGVVADVRTVAGYGQIAAIRTEIREKARYPMQRLQEAGSKMLGTMQRQFNARAKELIEEVERIEAPFQEQLDAEDLRKAKLREERDRVERARVDSHLQYIALIAGKPGRCAGFDSAGLELALAEAGAFVINDALEEFQGQGQQAKDEAIRALTGMLVAARADEAERAEIESTRAQQAAFAAQQAQVAAQQAAENQRLENERKRLEEESAALRQKLADAEAREREQQERAAALQRQQEAQEAALAAERERASAQRREDVQGRINAIGAYGAPLEGRPSEQLRALDEGLKHAALTADLFDDRVAEAEAARDARRGEVQDALEAALEREDEAARARRATQVNDLIDGMRAMGLHAAQAVTDGSADVGKLREGLQRLQEIDCIPLMFDGRVAEAAEVRAAAVAATELAISLTIERDRAAAEQAAADAKMRQRHLRISATMVRTYALLIRLTSDPGVTLPEVYRAEAEAIVNEVEGE